MNWNRVWTPIKDELAQVRGELKTLNPTFGFDATIEVLGYFAQMPGKLLRPALVLLAAKAVQKTLQPELIRVATAMELIHGASLIHDDILDDGVERRGQPTINAVWGAKVAVLAGDVLYSRAFGILTDSLPVDLLRRVVRLNEVMCSAEIAQAKHHDTALDRSTYFEIIEGKTASFMELACLLGAFLGGGNDHDLRVLAKFGKSLGIAYQLYDDADDGDLTCSEVDGVVEGRRFAEEAINTVTNLENTSASRGLAELVRALMDAHPSKDHS